MISFPRNLNLIKGEVALLTNSLLHFKTARMAPYQIISNRCHVASATGFSNRVSDRGGRIYSVQVKLSPIHSILLVRTKLFHIFYLGQLVFRSSQYRSVNFRRFLLCAVQHTDALYEGDVQEKGVGGGGGRGYRSSCTKLKIIKK